MARSFETTTTVNDDLDGTPDARSVKFTLLGRSLLLDLGRYNEQRLEVLLADLDIFLSKARRPALPNRDRAAKAHTAEVRRWAQEQGLLSSASGRLPKSVHEAYEAAVGATRAA